MNGLQYLLVDIFNYQIEKNIFFYLFMFSCAWAYSSFMKEYRGLKKQEK
jgi:hypothetical protein